jgi:adenine-specific DNA-methyltransferase
MRRWNSGRWNNALNEAGNLFPLPKMIVFCAFTFDPEAAKDIDASRASPR